MTNVIDLLDKMKNGEEYFIKAEDGCLYYEGRIGKKHGKFYYDLEEFSGYGEDVDNDNATGHETAIEVGHLALLEWRKE